MTGPEPGGRDYYEILGVDREATPRQIKEAFRELALAHHPDRSSEPDAEERFKEIAEAYAVLSDPERRATYDRGGFIGMSPEDLFAGIDLEDLFGGMGFGFDLGAGLFGELFGGRRRRGPRRGRDIELAVTVSLEEVATGVVRPVEIPRLVECSACGGSGAAPGSEIRRCADCEGSGQRTVSRSEHNTLIRQITICPSCGGDGRVIEEPCLRCEGRGDETTTDSLEVTIPVGVDTGTALRIPGRGNTSPDAGGPSGDAYVVVRVRPDGRFERRGPHLWRSQPIAVTDAVLGGEIVTPTLDGPLRVDVPAGTQPGSVLRLPGKGLPQAGGGPPGDLFLAIDVEIPTAIDTEQRRLYEQLRVLE